MIVSLILIFISGILLGYSLNRLVESYKVKKKLDGLNNTFKSVLSYIKSGKSTFKTRFASNVYINVYLEEHGPVELIYMIDKKDLAIFKNGNCIYITTGVDEKIVKDIITEIKKAHGKNINDVVNLFGLILGKKEFESITKMKVEDLNRIQYGAMNMNEMSDIDKIVKNNEIKFDIDEILDKISSIGIESLSKDEKDFLEKYSKNND